MGANLLALPLAAATGTSEILFDLFLVLLAAKIGDEVFKRLGQPAIVGEILAGVAIGPSLLGIVEPGEVLEVFAELGVIFLLFWVGLETRVSEMRRSAAPRSRSGRSASSSPSPAASRSPWRSAKRSARRCSSARRSRRPASASPRRC